MKRFKPIKHDEHLDVVGHLDELRFRVVVSLAAFGTALGLCFWQNRWLLDLVNQPLGPHRHPVTLGVAEPFTTTLTVSAYAAIVLAFSPAQKRVAVPLLLMVPFLFIAGVAFAYLLVIPAALQFLLHFNHSQFNTQIRAKDYYGFVSLTLLACGGVFQLPVGILGLTKMGITSPAKLRKNRRYAILMCALVAAALPGVDPVSMLLEFLPLLVLYEVSIWVARLVELRRDRVTEEEPVPGAS
jgi:sec-independent protein translocase protein TatC